MAQQCLVQFTAPFMMHNLRPIFPQPQRMGLAQNQLPDHLSPPHVHQQLPYIHQPPPDVHKSSNIHLPYRQIVPTEQNLRHNISSW